MKRIKKLASLFLAMVMALSMALSVSAAQAPTDDLAEGNYPAGSTGNFKITISDTTPGYTYAAYQVFAGDLSVDADGNKTLSNIQWGNAVDTAKAATVFAGKTAEQVAAELANGTYVKDENGTYYKLKSGSYTATAPTEDTASNYDSTTVKYIRDGFDSDGAQEFATKIASVLNKNNVAGTAATPNPVISGLTPGYYLVENTTIAANGDYTRYMMEVVGNVTATPKRGTTSVDKDIAIPKPDGVEGKDYVKVNNAPIGEKVEYRIPVTLPDNLADYNEYYLEIVDTLTKGLTYNNDAVVTLVNGENEYPVTEKFSITTAASATVAGATQITVSIQDLLSFNVKADGWTPIPVTKDTKVVLTYTATVNSDAVIGVENGNPNYVKVVHSNNPNNSGNGSTTPPPDNPNPVRPNAVGETPEAKVITYVTKLVINKTDESGNFLPGVEFTLTSDDAGKVNVIVKEEFVEDANGEYWKLKVGTYTKQAPVPESEGVESNYDDYDSVTTKYKKTTTLSTDSIVTENTTVIGTVDDNGVVTFTGLGAGKYVLSETKTLAGYNTIEDIYFEITFAITNVDERKGTFTLKEYTDDTYATEVESPQISLESDNTYVSNIVNRSGSLLPSTGGIGTTIFYVVGGILVIGAGILLVTKRRMRAQ